MGTHDRDLPSEEVILDTDDDATKETKKQLTKTREEKVSQSINLSFPTLPYTVTLPYVPFSQAYSSLTQHTTLTQPTH